MKSRLLIGVGVLGCSAFLLAFIPSVQASHAAASASAVVVAHQPLMGGQGIKLCGGDKGKDGTGGEGTKLCGGNKGKDGTGGEGTKLCGGDKGKDGTGGEGSKLRAGTLGGSKSKLFAGRVKVKDGEQGDDEGGDEGDEKGGGGGEGEPETLGAGCGHDKPASQAAD